MSLDLTLCLCLLEWEDGSKQQVTVQNSCDTDYSETGTGAAKTAATLATVRSAAGQPKQLRHRLQ